MSLNTATKHEHDIKVNVYKESGEWFFAVWIDGEYDTNGSLSAETRREAVDEVLAVWPDATVTVV